MNKIIDNITAVFKYRWKVFLLSLVVQFILTFLLHTGVQTPGFLSFLSFQHWGVQARLVSPVVGDFDVFKIIKTKLEEQPNHFQLKKEISFVPAALAGSDYDQAESYIVVDLDNGQVLASKDSDKKLPMASITKIMTGIVALDLASSGEYFKVSEKAAKTIPTKINVVAGSKMSLSELLQASLITSANDATQVIVDGINQKYLPKDDVFIRAMNEKAKLLGLKNTHFTNSQGFDNPRHYSTSEDLAVLSAYALNNYPQLKEIVNMDYQTLPANSQHNEFGLYNWNGLLGVYPGVYGVKIGNTGKAGFTTVVAAGRPAFAEASTGKDEHHVLVVLLGAPGVLERDMWASQLLNFGFQKFGLDPVVVTEFQLRAKYATWRY